MRKETAHETHHPPRSRLKLPERAELEHASARYHALERREAKHLYYSLSDTHLLRLVESAMEHAPAKQ
jgi:hypothetical protein